MGNSPSSYSYSRMYSYDSVEINELTALSLADHYAATDENLNHTQHSI